ncbi:MAG: Stp1/IreP family PP2C-type Ser/Thr phosphatase [Chlamydiae bacterium]|nr:Stp1/IreP family PP2C-type Ser/Thr phosphatase [Chlamydiota bacterium]
MTSFFDVISFGISDIGHVRDKNEDVWKSLPSHFFFVVADGMGGHKAGEIAAREAVDNLSESITRIFSSYQNKNTETDHIIGHLYYAIQDANYWVKDLAEKNKDYAGMGTTICCFLIHKNKLIYAHVGDSRIYRFNKELNQLSEDHSLKNYLLKKGKLTKENVERYPYKNRITKAIGTQTQVIPDIDYIDIEPGDIFFLCSDGLTDHLSNDHITNILKQTDCVENASQKLVEEAKKRGGRDNITVLMIKILEKETQINSTT